jgi:hypothetical protein
VARGSIQMTLPGEEVHQLDDPDPSGLYARKAGPRQMRLWPACFYAILLTYVARLPWPSKSWAAAGLSISTTLGLQGALPYDWPCRLYALRPNSRPLLITLGGAYEQHPVPHVAHATNLFRRIKPCIPSSCLWLVSTTIIDAGRAAQCSGPTTL